ncbi:hypothetical protein [Rhizobium sp. LjRoot254]|uniref:hypothetical protein n=1 Tax=Rhizobium sp. LjRoot254 TaxID=3342297 RepID=UPI003ECD6C7D
MPHESQTELVAEIAGLLAEYHKRKSAFTRFGLRGGVALNRDPAGCIIMTSATQNDETYQVRDPALRKGQASEKDAFFAGIEKFAANGAFLAWNGKRPPGKFDTVRDMSESFAHPTMTIEMAYQRRGETDEHRLNMFFIGFADEAAAAEYAERKSALVK